MKLTIKSHAKLNLFLKVFPKNETNLHPIHSIMQEITLHDIVTIHYAPSKNPSLSLTGSGFNFPTDNSNSIFKVINPILAKCSHTYAIHIHKNIPLGSGMGGASSNAAYVLKAINKIEKLKLKKEKLEKLALKAGTDTLFFLKGEGALVTGTGTNITPYKNTENKAFLIICPNIHCSTKEVYDVFDQIEQNKNISQPTSISYKLGENDLKPAIFQYNPTLKNIYTAIKKRLNSSVYITGSGSTLYIPLKNNSTAELNLKTSNQFKLFYIKKTYLK